MGRRSATDDGAKGAPLVELASGIDSLYMSGTGDVSPALLRDLDLARGRAQELDAPVPLDLAGSTVLVQPGPWGRYRYRLQHEHGLVGLTDKRSIPPLRIQPTAGYLRAVGADRAVDYFTSMGNEFTHSLYLSASRVDLFVDTQGWDLTADDRRRFVTRASKRRTNEDADAFTGLEFGRRTTKTVLARIYDKTIDSALKGTDWWHEVWGSAWDQTSRVLRVEVEFGREGLNQYGVRSVNDALDKVGSLWAAATSDWITFRTPTDDQTKSRWPIAPEWKQIQAASLAQNAIGLERLRAGRQKGSLRTILPMLVGYLASGGAHLHCANLADTLSALVPHIDDYALVTGTPFGERILAKRRAMGLA
jgi:hypothetical protein